MGEVETSEDGICALGVDDAARPGLQHHAYAEIIQAVYDSHQFSEPAWMVGYSHCSEAYVDHCGDSSAHGAFSASKNAIRLT